MNDTVEKDGVKTFYAQDKNAWRQWLQENHATEKSVWLIIYRQQSQTPSVYLYYSEAVDEALCFGWIDSKPNKRNNESFYQFFAKRRPKSNWSRVNKLKVEKLLAGGMMAEAGLQAVETAKQNGTWATLDDVENLILPADLREKLNGNPAAEAYFEAFPRSAKRGILEWILNSKRPETRAARIAQTVRLAQENRRANSYQP